MSAVSPPASVSGTVGGPPAIPHLDVDPFAIEFFEDPYPAQQTLREAGPVVFLDKWDVYGVARYAEVHAVLNDPATFCSSRGVGLSDFKKGETVAPAKHHSGSRPARAYANPVRAEQGAVPGRYEADPRSLRGGR